MLDIFIIMLYLSLLIPRFALKKSEFILFYILIHEGSFNG